MKHYIYFSLNILAIFILGSFMICMVGSFVEYKTSLGANYISGLFFFGIVCFLVISFSIIWFLDSWCDLQRAINRSK